MNKTVTLSTALRGLLQQIESCDGTAQINTTEAETALKGACENYEFLAQLKPNSWSLEMNEHAASYVTAKKWIEEYGLEEDWADVPPDLVDAMKNTDTIYRFQIYPDTPGGFYRWYGPTLDSVIEQARAALGT